jgi:hypothetical protein
MHPLPQLRSQKLRTPKPRDVRLRRLLQARGDFAEPHRRDLLLGVRREFPQSSLDVSIADLERAAVRVFDDEDVGEGDEGVDG